MNHKWEQNRLKLKSHRTPQPLWITTIQVDESSYAWSALWWLEGGFIKKKKRQNNERNPSSSTASKLGWKITMKINKPMLSMKKSLEKNQKDAQRYQIDWRRHLEWRCYRTSHRWLIMPIKQQDQSPFMKMHTFLRSNLSFTQCSWIRSRFLVKRWFMCKVLLYYFLEGHAHEIRI